LKRRGSKEENWQGELKEWLGSGKEQGKVSGRRV